MVKVPWLQKPPLPLDLPPDTWVRSGTWSDQTCPLLSGGTGLKALLCNQRVGRCLCVKFRPWGSNDVAAFHLTSMSLNHCHQNIYFIMCGFTVPGIIKLNGECVPNEHWISRWTWQQKSRVPDFLNILTIQNRNSVKIWRPQVLRYWKPLFVQLGNV